MYAIEDLIDYFKVEEIDEINKEYERERKAFLDTYGNCKSAAEYWNLKVDNGLSSLYKNKKRLPVYDENALMKDIEVFRKELLRRGIYFAIAEWQKSFESLPVELYDRMKKEIRRKYKLKGKFSYVFTTENEIYTAVMKYGKFDFAGQYASSRDLETINELFSKQFYDYFNAKQKKLVQKKKFDAVVHTDIDEPKNAFVTTHISLKRLLK